MAKTIGRIAYEGYCDSYHSINGYTEWENLDALQQMSWERSALAIIKYIEREKEDFYQNQINQE